VDNFDVLMGARGAFNDLFVIFDLETVDAEDRLFGALIVFLCRLFADNDVNGLVAEVRRDAEGATGRLIWFDGGRLASGSKLAYRSYL